MEKDCSSTALVLLALVIPAEEEAKLLAPSSWAARGGCCESPLQIMVLLGQSAERAATMAVPGDTLQGAWIQLSVTFSPEPSNPFTQKLFIANPFEKLSEEEIYPSRIFILFPLIPLFSYLSFFFPNYLWEPLGFFPSFVPPQSLHYCYLKV